MSQPLNTDTDTDTGGFAVTVTEVPAGVAPTIPEAVRVNLCPASARGIGIVILATVPSAIAFPFRPHSKHMPLALQTDAFCAVTAVPEATAVCAPVDAEAVRVHCNAEVAPALADN